MGNKNTATNPQDSSSRVNFVTIPKEVKDTCPFCVWKKTKRGGQVTKVPYNPRTGEAAKTNDPSTFGTFAEAIMVYTRGGWDGIGAIDIDHCIREDGSLNDIAASILSFFPDTYFERSPSGTGLRGLSPNVLKMALS